MFKKRMNRITPGQMIILSFATMIFIGACLLMLPFATSNGKGAPFLDALFTSTSASCVTGLIMHDTAQYWSPFGQLVILTLIQIGGMGVITMAIILSVLGGKKIGFKQRYFMQQSISAPKLGGIIRNTKWILKATLCVEALGAILLGIRFLPRFGLVKGIWYSIFHSISAFCNAGFDLMGTQQAYSSLTSYYGDILISNVIAALIVLGGLGFFVWKDVVQYKRHLHKYSLQSKVVLFTTAALLIISTLYFYINDFSHWNMSLADQINVSIFQAVSPRTAGFNTIDLNKMNQSSILFMTLLMLIGGSPQGTAGGFKTTTLAVLILSIRAVFNHKQNPQCFGRRISIDSLNNATALFMLFIVLFFTGALLISAFDQLPILDALFEAASAIGTVGLTLGITPTLSSASHCILIFLMFFGRVGGLTLLLAISKHQVVANANLPQENITIG